MAIVIPYTRQIWTDGSGGGTPVSAARLAVMEEGLVDVSQAPAVRVFHNAATAIVTSTTTALNFNSERYDQAGGASAAQHDTVTNNNRLTCLYAGIYMIDGHIQWAASTSGNREISIRLNGATFIADHGSSPQLAINFGQSICTTYTLAVNDYVELLVWQNSGGNLNVNSTGNYSPEFGMVRLA